MGDREYERLLIRSTGALAGRQVTSAHDLYRLIGGESPGLSVAPEIIDLMAQVLRDLGYKQRWVNRLDEPEITFLWVREKWMIDTRSPVRQRAAIYVPI